MSGKAPGRLSRTNWRQVRTSRYDGCQRWTHPCCQLGYYGTPSKGSATNCPVQVLVELPRPECQLEGHHEGDESDFWAFDAPPRPPSPSIGELLLVLSCCSLSIVAVLMLRGDVPAPDKEDEFLQRDRVTMARSQGAQEDVEVRQSAIVCLALPRLAPVWVVEVVLRRSRRKFIVNLFELSFKRAQKQAFLLGVHLQLRPELAYFVIAQLLPGPRSRGHRHGGVQQEAGFTGCANE